MDKMEADIADQLHQSENDSCSTVNDDDNAVFNNISSDAYSTQPYSNGEDNTVSTSFNPI